MEEIYLKGDDRLVILCHAYTSTPADVRRLAGVLHRLGYSVVLPTFLGHDQKDMRVLLGHSPNDWQKQIEQLVDKYGQMQYKKIAIFGLSMGGMMAMHLLTQKNKYLIGGGSFNSPIPIIDSSKVKQAFLMFAQKRYDQSFGKYEDYLAQIVEYSEKQIDAIQALTENIAEKLSDIEVPVYIAQSLQDELIDINSGKKLANSLLFASVTYDEFEQSTHVITLGKEKDIFNQKVVAFINGLDWKS